jgi:hypothetical protein
MTKQVKSKQRVADYDTYSTNWALVQSSTVLCNLPVKIIVK